MLDSLYTDHLAIQRARTDAALAHCGFDSLAIYAGGEQVRFLDDTPYPFKLNAHFALWAPLAEPIDCWIVYRPEQRLQLVLLQPLDYWHKAPSIPDDYWTRHFDIQIIRTAAEARTFLSDLPRCALIGEPRAEFSDWGFAAINPQPLLDRLHFERAIKTAYEIECMRRASRIAALGHRAAQTAFRAGASEYDIHQAYLTASLQTDRELPYGSIVALNANAAILHYQHQERAKPAERFSFLIDAGAQFNGYASDVTRTYSYADDEFAALIQTMHGVQQKLCGEVRAGTDYVDIHLDAHRLIGDALYEARCIRLRGDDALECGLTSVFFPHGVGHLIGLQVHDVAGRMSSPDGAIKAPPAGHPFLRLTRTLEPGFVVTIEPGVYFIDLLLAQASSAPYAQYIDWERVDAFRPFGGIRIEDDVVCTGEAPENLTRDAFALA
jgi:Xaa-Pro dipeptidase